MQNIIEEFKRTISESYDQLVKISDAESAKPLSAGKWSRKEVLGHLIDSASNNHHRFIRAQLTENASFPSYESERWVALQDYKNEVWEDLTLLWKSYNRHLLYIVSHIPEDKVSAWCTVGDDQPVTLSFMVEDYVKHMKHHLNQILSK